MIAAMSKTTSDISRSSNHKSTKLEQKQHFYDSSLPRLENAILHRHDKTTPIYSIS